MPAASWALALGHNRGLTSHRARSFDSGTRRNANWAMARVANCASRIMPLSFPPAPSHTSQAVVPVERERRSRTPRRAVHMHTSSPVVSRLSSCTRKPIDAHWSRRWCPHDRTKGNACLCSWPGTSCAARAHANCDKPRGSTTVSSTGEEQGSQREPSVRVCGSGSVWIAARGVAHVRRCVAQS